MLIVFGLLTIALAGSAFIGGGDDIADSDTDGDDLFFQDVDVAVEADTIGPLGPDEAAQDASDGSPPSEDYYGFDSEFLNDRSILTGSSGDDFVDGSDGEHVSIADHVFGGDGDDTLKGAAGDVLVGGAGLDTFQIVGEGEVVVFDLEPDEVVVVYHDGETPEITGNADDGGTTLFKDGTAIVHLNDVYDFDFSRIMFVQSN